jgi:uncharacterized membrane protein
MASIVSRESPPRARARKGAVVFLVGAIGLTAAVNVPMNDALAAVDPASVRGAEVWRDYVVRWTRFNDVRALASVVATALLALSVSGR